MSDAKAQAEPTMEEILASIRRIISEEGDDPDSTTVKLAKPEPVDEPAPPAAPPPPAPPPPSPPRAEEPPMDDVLTLTDLVGDDGSVTSLDPDPVDDWPPEPEPPPPPRYDPPPRPAPASRDRLTSPGTAAMASAAFGEISSRLGMPRSGRGGGGRTVEELVEDVVRPMLQQWLDENLPELVERLVAEEIQRLSGRGPLG
ncbi:DUF2497 domain-containing protein [Zavarzinia sp. CC-PAN008]|uniref:DUF2497 domain-containing protein n=1 Tax=Zavarzinia sp. CC-PAN008 TaxID=3243332 RepID=UPI003F7496BD